MKTSHPRIQRNIWFIYFTGVIFWKLPAATSSYQVGPKSPNAAVYIHLPGVGGGEEAPKQTDWPKKKKLWAEPSKGTKLGGEDCGEGSLGATRVCGHLASLTQRNAPGRSKASLWGKKQKLVITKVTLCTLLLGFCLVLSVKVVLPLPLKKNLGTSEQSDIIPSPS